MVIKNSTYKYMIESNKNASISGGQLRYQLYIWLEREVEALRELCSYTSSVITDAMDLDATVTDQELSETSPRPTLHEILIQEKLDFEAKVQRAAKRKRWLRGMYLLKIHFREGQPRYLIIGLLLLFISRLKF